MKTFFIMLTAASLLYGSYTSDADSQTVYDDQTDLTWEDGVNHLRAWGDAIDYCESLNIVGTGDWRLPSVNELLSIVDYNGAASAVNPAFNFLINQPHWSATTDATDSTYAWYVNFSDGYSRSFPKAVRRYVRCVRKGKLSGSQNANTATLPAIFYLLQ
ncbi:MAG: hypothetical protein DSZ03_06910 [Sulfurimonas sp.]|nr:MAG: hypothetical protein DSZ03_06910 [Sulfurimonas sp.]